MTYAGHVLDDRLLRIYLQDHYAVQVGGARLARRIADAHRVSPHAGVLDAVAGEFAGDVHTLTLVMQVLGITPDRRKAALAVGGERLGRLTRNGHVVRRSPLSSLEELDALAALATGKAALWRALRQLTPVDDRLDPAQLDGLLGRADAQRDVIEDVRMVTVLTALTEG